MPKLGLLERYVMMRTLSTVGVALAVIALIILLIDFVELSRDVGARAETGFLAVLGLTLMKSPTTVLVLLPFVFLFGVQFAFVLLNRGSELIAMRAAGVSAWRFIFPAAAAAFGSVCWWSRSSAL
jgi:lipopolysaccharide export system permease protein